MLSRYPGQDFMNLTIIMCDIASGAWVLFQRFLAVSSPLLHLVLVYINEINISIHCFDQPFVNRRNQIVATSVQILLGGHIVLFRVYGGWALLQLEQLVFIHTGHVMYMCIIMILFFVQPPFSMNRFSGMMLLGYTWGQIIMLAMPPNGIWGINLRFFNLLIPLATALGELVSIVIFLRIFCFQIKVLSVLDVFLY